VSSIVTLADYQRITHDLTTYQPTVDAALADAQLLVEEFLRRPLTLMSRTERMRLYSAENLDGGYDGAYLCYPKATPVQTVDGGLTVLSAVAVAGAFPDGGPFLEGIIGQGVQPYATISYTGGYTADTLPATLRREIVITARGGIIPATTVPPGATAVKVGDVSVTYQAAEFVGAALSPSTMRTLRRYVRRRGA
jgi:hypothetical protein